MAMSYSSRIIEERSAAMIEHLVDAYKLGYTDASNGSESRSRHELRTALPEAFPTHESRVLRAEREARQAYAKAMSAPDEPARIQVEPELPEDAPRTERRFGQEHYAPQPGDRVVARVVGTYGDGGDELLVRENGTNEPFYLPSGTTFAPWTPQPGDRVLVTFEAEYSYLMPASAYRLLRIGTDDGGADIFYAPLTAHIEPAPTPAPGVKP